MNPCERSGGYRAREGNWSSRRSVMGFLLYCVILLVVRLLGQAYQARKTRRKHKNKANLATVTLKLIGRQPGEDYPPSASLLGS